MTHLKASFIGRMRRLAFALWRGPEYIKKQDDADFVSGFCILHLALQKGTFTHPLLESRTVYGFLEQEDQQVAALRGLSWDSRMVPRGRDIPYERPLIKIPAKYVEISILQVKQWIGAFENLQTVLHFTSYSDPDGSFPICTLRVQIELVDCVFEKVWQVRKEEQSELDRVWQEVWQQMGLALQTSPVLTGIEETFPCTQPEPDGYDFQSYQPSLDLP